MVTRACISTGDDKPKPSNCGTLFGEWMTKMIPASTKPRVGSSVNSSWNKRYPLPNYKLISILYKFEI